MALATVTVEHADGTTEVWNVTQDKADDVREHMLLIDGAPDLIN